MNLYKIFYESQNKIEKQLGIPKTRWLATDGDYDHVAPEVAAAIGQKVLRIHEEGKILYVGKKEQRGSDQGRGAGSEGSAADRGRESMAGNKNQRHIDGNNKRRGKN